MRKLANAAFAFSAAIFAANYILPFDWLLIPAVAAGVLGAALALLQRKWLRPLVMALIFVSLGLLYFYLYAQSTTIKAKEVSGKTETITARLLSYPDVYDDYCRAEVRITSENLPHFKALLYDNDKQLTEAVPGQTVKLDAKLSTADTLYGESYDAYNSKGLFLKASSKGSIELTDRSFDVRTVPARISHFMSERVNEVFPEDTAVFMKSLMLGDKQDFYGDRELYLAMSRAGLMHIVAVSGMHVSFLVSLLVFILGNGRLSALISIPLVWLFVLITGAAPSAIRAGFMQTVLLLAPILRRENDPITSLALILAAILLCNPYAAASVSLQLSFGAMAGIICFSEKIYEALQSILPDALRKKPIRYALATTASSLGVMVFTVPLTAIHFGTVPILSGLTNIAALWTVSLCFCGGWISCALSLVPFLGKAAAFLCSYLARYIFLVAKLISSVPFAVLYMKTEGAAYWVLFSYLLFAAAWMLRRLSAKKYAAAAALSAAALVLILVRSDRLYRSTDTASVLDVGQGQCITVFAGDSTVVIDCGNISNLNDAGMTAGEYLKSCGRDRVDLLLLTHLHEDHADGVPMLMEMLPVGTLILPEKADDADGLYNEIKACAQKHGTDIIELDRNTALSCGRIGMEVFRTDAGSSENENCLMTMLSIGTYKLLITADADSDMERELVRAADLSGTDALIVGHHGSKYASSPELLRAAGGRLAVISVGYNRYGHPAEETLERLANYGYNVLRTDEDGTVEIRIGKNNG